MKHLDYIQMILEADDVLSVKAKLDAKKRGLTHQSHNVWKDKSGQEYKWNDQLKRFDKIEKKQEVKINKNSNQHTGMINLNIKIDLNEKISYNYENIQKEIVKSYLSEIIKNLLLSFPDLKSTNIVYDPQSNMMKFDKPIQIGDKEFSLGITLNYPKIRCHYNNENLDSQNINSLITKIKSKIKGK